MKANEAAFPHTVEYKGADCGGSVPHGGMSLRDYFAAKAMQGIMSNPQSGLVTADEIAITAYVIADAMLEERE